MTNGNELKSRAAAALRDAGFVPLPRLWVKRLDLDLIKAIATRYDDEVNSIRHKVHRVDECAEQVRLGRADRDLAEMGFAFGAIAAARKIVKQEKDKHDDL